MEVDLLAKAQWGNLEGQNWAVLARLSTDERDETAPEDVPEHGRRVPLTGRDIKSTEEQTLDGREFVKARGGRVVHVYLEPDTSAWRKKRIRQPDGRVVYRVVRPVFEGALEDLKAGLAPNGERLDGLVVYDIDRLTRDPRHLEDAIDVVERSRRPILDITGSLDLLTENGRAVARMVVTMSNKQSADTSRRVSRKHRALEREGIPTGGARPFGWNADKRTLHERESVHLRKAVERLLGGAPLRAIPVVWNEAGITTPRGSKWNPSKVKEMLRNPRLCGYRSRKAWETNPTTGAERQRWEIVFDSDGKPVIGQWEKILTVEEWRALVEIIGEHAGPGDGHNSRKYLGTGTFRCDKDECGAPHRAIKAEKSANKPEGFFYYACPDKGQGGCGGGTKIPGPEADEVIKELVIAKWEEEAEAREVTAGPKEWDGEAKLTRVRENIEETREAREQRIISKEQYFSQLQKYTSEERRLQRERNQWFKQRYAGQGEPGNLREEWEGLTLVEQRSYVEQTLTAVLVAPAIGRRKPVHTRLTPLYRTESDIQESVED
ncbi:recombinase family protein [Streptomyces sp. NPDC056682]|uniref:recombinase family protein n=1 Tax=Streptomyces sp. NPDC056682 TaxID=3345909 RepID=UPI003688AB99